MDIYLFVFILFQVSSIYGRNERYFVSESCGHMLGPDFGAYLEFDRDIVFNEKAKPKVNIAQQLKGQLLECTVIIRGMPATPGVFPPEKRYMGIYWREFLVHDPNVKKRLGSMTPKDCGKAHVTMYNGKDKASATQSYTLCGVDTVSPSYEWEGEFITLFFYLDYRNPALGNGTTAPPDPAATVDPKATTPVDDFDYPEVFFKLDITSFGYACNDTIDDVVLMCNESKRCLDDSLRCDYWYSKNCLNEFFPKDTSDVTKKYPGLCGKPKKPKPTTTTPAPPVPPPDLSPLYIVLGLIVGLSILYWCCCRPGWLPWRCARIRNCPCCVSCGTCFATCCPVCSPTGGPGGGAGACYCGGGGGSPTGGAAWKGHLLDNENGSPGDSSPGGGAPPFTVFGGGGGGGGGVTGSPWKKKNAISPETPQKTTPSITSDPDTDSTALSNGWLNFLSGDGGHLREHR
ncbi:uncharacterized protein [Argopecten irradians]|uniref:uncharacterized protein n=1 Tax=Argopecten irradians TaxID=31199 RepID=UPI0037170495